MKSIEVPDPVEVVLGKRQDGTDAKDTVTFNQFLVDMIDTYGETKTPKQLRQAMKLIAKVEEGKEAIHLEDSEYELLKGALEWPRQLNVKLARQLGPFYDALEEAGIGKD